MYLCILQGTLFCFSVFCFSVYTCVPVSITGEPFGFSTHKCVPVCVTGEPFGFSVHTCVPVCVTREPFGFGAHMWVPIFITGEPFGFSGHTQAHICVCSQSGVLVVEEATHRPLVEYVVVPSLPRAATVEWQVYARTQDAHFIGEIPLQCV